MEPEPGYGDEIKEGLKKFKYGSKKSLEAFKSWDLEESSKMRLGRGEIIVRNISARYAVATKNTLNEINLRISPGEKVGIVGRTGSGKSSIVKLLWQYMQPTEGSILLDGISYSELPVKYIRGHFGIVTQDINLFEGNILANIFPKLDPPELESLSPAKLDRLLSILEEVDFLRHFKSQRKLLQIDLAEGSEISLEAREQ